jgi:O-antigen/teichoic acid export membrane protein
MKVFKNFLYNVAYQVLIMILPLITAPYIARVLGAELIGIYSYTYSIAYFFLLFAQLGLSVYGNRTIAQVRDDKNLLSYTFFRIYKFQFIISIISSIAYVVFAALFVEGEYRIFFMIQFLYVVSGIFDTNWFFFGIEKFKLTVTRNMIIKIVTVCLILTLVKGKSDLWVYTLIMAAGTLLGQVVLWSQLFKYVSYVKTSLKDSFTDVWPIIILFLPTVATSLYRYMDKIMLGSMTTMNQLGFYENSEKFLAISMGVINALGTVMIPKVSNLIANNDWKIVKDYINKSIEGVFIIASPLCFGLSAIASILSVIFYGSEFVKCSEIIPVLSVSLLFSAWANVIRTQYLIPNGRDKEYIISMFCGAGANIIINYILIPRIGALGAAVGTVFAEAFVAIVHSFYVRKELPLIQYIRLTVPYIVIGIIMYCSVSYVGRLVPVSFIGLLSEILVGIIVYSICVFAYICIGKSQYYYIARDVISRRKKDSINSSTDKDMKEGMKRYGK